MNWLSWRFRPIGFALTVRERSGNCFRKGRKLNGILWSTLRNWNNYSLLKTLKGSVMTESRLYGNLRLFLRQSCYRNFTNRFIAKTIVHSRSSTSVYECLENWASVHLLHFLNRTFFLNGEWFYNNLESQLFERYIKFVFALRSVILLGAL